MAANSWTNEENEQFKNAVQVFSVFSPNRFERIAQFLGKSVVDVMEHYQKMVDDLLEIGSSQIALSNGLFDAAVPSWCRMEKLIWNKEEHEWFLIGLRRFGKKCDKIAVLVVTKTAMQVAIYARNFFNWQNPRNNVMKRRRTMDITMGDTSVDLSSPQKRIRGDINMDSTGQQESLVPLQPQPQQGPVALETGQDANISDSESDNFP
ncbi:Duplicated homeodomain-like superfamily protein [Raphanus sativus]|uniref:Transcription factor DIVARICATA-like n=1 Tax=Raphanus sativus TaxID=3726 RepID=A0A9W3C1A7_RAPSA|nr:transcription factor DIVARICATA-like [Raphanus sativus]KAJ4885863.1 Duplicated homeodomain-like superfamily protein [Raphanus sativus]